MLTYYLKFAFRHLRKSFSYSFINIAGLAIGIASILLIFLYVQHELSFDNYHEKGDRIYRIVDRGGSGENWSPFVEGDLPQEMRQAYSEVEDALTIGRACGSDFFLNGERVEQIDALCSESTMFNIFSFDLISGDPESALDQPQAVILSRSLAERLFPEENPIGQSIRIGGGYLFEEKPYTVTGVMEDVPANTHFSANMFISLSSMSGDSWQQAHFRYVLLKEGADPELVAERALDRMINVLAKGQETEELKLEALEEIHFSETHAERQGDIQYIYILSAIALSILILACGNYLNLATAKYVRRSREIGIRKVLGAHRTQLVRQLFFESILLSVLALPIAILLVYSAIPWFNSYAGTELTPAVAGYPWFYLALVGIIGITGFLAGSYPALVISSLKPTQALAGKQQLGWTGKGFRNGLVSFQFMASIVMIGITFIFLQQLTFVQNKNLGFESEHLVRVNITDPALRSQATALKQEFLQYPSVENATVGAAPGTIGFTGIYFGHQPDPQSEESVSFLTPSIDSDFLETMSIPLLAGRNISEEISESGLESLISEKGVRELGYTDLDQVLGETIFRYRVVGVISDFHSQSLQKEIEPVLLGQSARPGGFSIVVRLAGGDIRRGLNDLRSAWENAGATTELQYTFVDDLLQQQYEQEQQTAKVIGMFAGLSIFIACMGLFGLAAFTVEQRTKEIGIRKVLGASISSIVLLLYRDFGKLLTVATILAVPVIYIAAGRWLENFAFRVEIGPFVFILSVLAVCLLALITTGGRSLQAALMNPVDAIRDE